MLFWISIFCLVAVIFTWRRTRWKKQNIATPPGPWSKLPVSTRAKKISKHQESLIQELSEERKKHGDIFLDIRNGLHCIYICSRKLMEESLTKTEPSDQSVLFSHVEENFNQILNNNQHRSLSPSGEEWKEQQQLGSKLLKDMMCSTPSMEDLVLEELAAFSAQLREDLETGPIDMDTKWREVVFNIMWTIAQGNRFDYDDEDFIFLINHLNIAFEPSKEQDSIAKSWAVLYDTFEKKVNNHLEERKQEHSNNFIDIYLNEMNKRVEFGNGRSYFTKEFGKHLLVCLLLEMFLAAAESTLSSLLWLVVHMVRNPEVQNKVQQELDHMIGPRALPRIEDRENTALTLAVMDEVSRLSSPVPLSSSQVVGEPGVVGGFYLPKHIPIYHNHWQINRDPLVWDQPDFFNPRRFLDEYGEYKPTTKLLQFGGGSRKCLREVLSRAQVYPLFSGLLHQFTLRNPRGDLSPSVLHTCGVTLLPTPFKVELISRPRQKTFRGRIRSDTD